MEEFITKYGPLKGPGHPQFYPDGSLKQCVLNEENKIETHYGVFIPHYIDDDPRRKRVKPITFHENGVIKSFPLQEQTQIETSCGSFPAEMITWYENGRIRRLFPLDGNITGFWTEDNEYELAPVFDFELPFGSIRQKIVAIQFYEDGTLKNLTFWSRDKIRIHSPLGEVEARIGIEMFPDGTLKAFEPGLPLAVETPIGTIRAYDPKAIGIHSDSLSLRFGITGEIETVTTSMDMVTVEDEEGNRHVFKPQLKPSMFNLDALELFPLKIKFFDSKIAFEDNPDQVFDILRCKFVINPVFMKSTGTCTSCDNCTACG